MTRYRRDHGLITRIAIAGMARNLPGDVSLILDDRTTRSFNRRLASAVQAAAEDGRTVFAEVSAHPVPRPAIARNRTLDSAHPPVAAIKGLGFLKHQDGQDVDEWLLDIAWRPTAPAQPADPRPADDFVVLSSDEYAETISSALRAAGVRAEAVIAPADETPLGPLRDALGDYWRESAPPRAVVVALAARAGDQDPGSQALSQSRRLIEIAQAIVAAFAEPPRLYVITLRESDADDIFELAQGGLCGIVRVLTCEHPELRPTHIDADPGDDALQAVIRELLSDDGEDEVSLHSGTRRVARLAYAPLKGSAAAAAPAHSADYGGDGLRLRVRRFADLSALELAANHRRAPGPGEVELRVHGAGINFRDVLTAMGLLGTDKQARSRIGFECCGEVTAVGPDVEHVRVGDTVVSMSLSGGLFASFATVPAAFVAAVPPGLDPAAAAGVPIAFATAWYALRRVARLTAGERVLIHSAAGGTGLAALQIARLVGAEVLATAGSPAKRSYLRELGIEHVMDSRSLDFAEQARAATGGEGVDVVLDSLSGPAIRAGLLALRPFGRFIELGMRDINADLPLGMAAMRHNITFSTVDLNEVQQSRPDELAAVLRTVLAEVAHGRLVPLPHRAFTLTDACDAFRFMADARHTGKLILTVPRSGRVAVAAAPATVRSDGTYIVTGGLRGVGLETVRWLVGQGAGHVVVNGRTAPGEEAERVLTQLRKREGLITMVLGDIAEPGTAERLVAAAGDKPVRGIVHAATVLDDAALADITEEQLVRVWRPKVDGAWRLHEAVAECPVDWFVVYSSMNSALGNAGQGAYAAANSWLDAFAAWRTAQGFRTLAIDWGPWGETGAGTDFAARGYQSIPPRDGLRALGELLSSPRVRTAVIPGEPATWVPAPARGSRFFGEV